MCYMLTHRIVSHRVENPFHEKCIELLNPQCGAGVQIDGKLHCLCATKNMLRNPLIPAKPDFWLAHAHCLRTLKMVSLRHT